MREPVAADRGPVGVMATISPVFVVRLQGSDELQQTVSSWCGCG